MTRVPDPIDGLPDTCRETVGVLQRVLDGDLPRTELDADPHLPLCLACRERIATARLMVAALAASADSLGPPLYLAAAVVAEVQSDWAARQRLRRRAYGFAGLAVAATVLATAWLTWFRPAADSSRPGLEVANSQPTPPVHPSPETAKPPVRLADQFAKAEHALLESSRPLTEPAATAPQLLAKITDALTRATPSAQEFEPARQSILGLPEAARSGLEPVTATTQKAFARLLKDVGMGGSW